MINVVNVKEKLPLGIYIGRGTPLGSPFSIGRDGTRAQVIEKYRQWLDKQGPTTPAGLELVKLAAMHRADDLVLACHCKPLDCHGDVIAERVAAMTPEVS